MSFATFDFLRFVMAHGFGNHRGGVYRQLTPKDCPNALLIRFLPVLIDAQGHYPEDVLGIPYSP